MRRRTLVTALALSAPAALGLPTAAFARGGAVRTSDPRTPAILARYSGLALTAEGRALQSILETERLVGPEQIRRVIDGSLYECGPTALDAAVAAYLADWTEEDFEIILGLSLLDWPAFQALIFGADGAERFGRSGERTKELGKTFGKLQGFWDVDGSDIQLRAMHGSIFSDTEALVPFVTFMFEIGEAEARELIAAVQDFLAQPRFAGGENPIFTLNAFAYSERDLPAQERLGLPDVIVMGDGVMQVMEEAGLGDVAPRMILAHEYGHHVQFRLGRFSDHAGTPEATRETELEADALASYYLSHPRGERLRNKRVEAYLLSAYAVGDCAFTADGHHGTPNQRRASGAWADRLANTPPAKGKVLPARAVSDQFLAALPEILAPDAA